MVRRAASFFALLAFTAAFLVGLFGDLSPWVRLGRSLCALLVGAAAGAVGGLLLDRIVLAQVAREVLAQTKEPGAGGSREGEA